VTEKPHWIQLDNGHIVGTLHLPEDGDAPVIVISHGWGGKKSSYDAWIEYSRKLAEEGYAVYRFDFRGSGESSGDFENQTHSRMIEDLGHVVENLSEFDQVGEEIFLAGHSQGGYLSLLFAAENDVSGVISWMGRTHDLEDWWSEQTKGEMQSRGEITYEGRKITQNYYEDAKKFDIDSRLPEINSPVKLIYGLSDQTVPSYEGEKAAELIPNSDLELIEGLTHHFNQKDEVLQETIEFLNRVSRR
jgi:pimeloyl-ACP methyl ester carboxylesterase